MALKVDDIKQVISKIPFVKQIRNIEQRERCINGVVEIAFDELNGSLEFEFEIAPEYPLRTYGSESITFRNKNLIRYSHVMGKGNICIHTSHNTDLEQKITIDFASLKNWIKKYYVNKDKDSHYEHLIVNVKPVNDQYYAYHFTDCSGIFKKGEFGDVRLSYLNEGLYKEKPVINFLIQEFLSNENDIKECQWSNIYKRAKGIKNALYYFIEDPPATHNRFVFDNWTELTAMLPTDFLDLLHRFEEKIKKKLKRGVIPIFLGYRINKSEIHWQAALLEVGQFPLIGVPERVNGIKTGKWYGQLKDEEITWGITRNTSYRFFFGRGTFSEQLTSKKILIIGVGAVGSMVATTLVRGGCRLIDFADYDIKEPENVCRSEYMFSNGITSKTEELKNILCGISPFVNMEALNNHYFESLIKGFHDDKERREKFADDLNNYDLIFDCSTDNDLMYALSLLDLKTEMINISITNHAKEIVCAFHPNIYRFVNNQFSNVLKNDTDDLYNPIGCWNPTFKASYNDINILVQLALKHLNSLFQNGAARNNFVVQGDKTNGGNLNIIEF